MAAASLLPTVPVLIEGHAARISPAHYPSQTAFTSSCQPSFVKFRRAHWVAVEQVGVNPHMLERAFAQQALIPYVQDGHVIRMGVVARPEPDLNRLSQALLAQVKSMARQLRAAQQRRKTKT